MYALVDVISQPWDNTFFSRSDSYSVQTYSLQLALSRYNYEYPFGNVYGDLYAFSDGCLTSHGPDCK